jgi:hypothetical protein
MQANIQHRKTIMAKKRTSPAAVKAARSEYSSVKRAYHKAGKAAFGKPSSSKVKRDYHALKRAYKSAGSRLGRLTGRKPRRSR